MKDLPQGLSPKNKKLISKKKLSKCIEEVDKVLSCPTCRKLINERLGNKNIFDQFVNDENREIIILILMGLIIIILLDLFIRISKSI